jgi:hypothetical protein
MVLIRLRLFTAFGDRAGVYRESVAVIFQAICIPLPDLRKSPAKEDRCVVMGRNGAERPGPIGPIPAGGLRQLSQISSQLRGHFSADKHIAGFPLR